MTVSFVRAGPGDADAVLSLMREYYAHDGLAFSEDGARAALLGLLNQPAHGGVWLIAAEETTAGYIALTYGYSLEFHGRDAFIDELYLREPHRRRGLGSAALKFAAGHCVSQGITSLHLAFERSNQAAQAFYLSQGWVGRGQGLLSLDLRPVEPAAEKKPARI